MDPAQSGVVRNKGGGHCKPLHDRGQGRVLENASLTIEATVRRGGSLVPPNFFGHFTHTLVGLRIAAQAGRAVRRVTPDRRAITYKRLDFFQQFRRHAPAIAQHEQRIRSSAWKREAAIFHRHLRDVPVGHQIELMGERNRRIEVGARWRVVGRALRGEAGDVRREPSLLEQKLAAREVVQPGFGKLEPCIVPVEMNPPLGHRHARRALPWLHGITVENQPVDPVAKHPVAENFVGEGMVAEPCLNRPRCERLGRHDLFPLRVGGGRRADRPTRTFVVQPELGHRHIRLAAGQHVVERAVAIRLRRKCHALLMRKPPEFREIIIGHHLADCSPQVPQKPLGLVHRTDDQSGQRGQPRRHVIPAALTKFLTHFRRPVLTADFPAIDMSHGQRFGVRTLGIGLELADKLFEVMTRRRATELVTFEPDAGRRCRMVFLAGGGRAEADDFPIPLRHFPGQDTIRSELVGEVHHIFRFDAACRANRRLSHGQLSADHGGAGLQRGGVRQRGKNHVSEPQLGFSGK